MRGDTVELDRHCSRLERAIISVRELLSDFEVTTTTTSVGLEAFPESAEANSRLVDIQKDLSHAAEATHALGQHATWHRNDIRLVGSIMSAEAKPGVALETAYRDFTNLVSDYLEESRIDNFPAEADAYAELNVIQSKLSRIRFAPRLARKNIVAVAGGFSSGKSSFINSLIGTEHGLLPTRITPTTAIPTYVHHIPSTPLEISLFNASGGKHLIDSKTLHSITHDFEREYGIELKQIVDRVVVSTPNLEGWSRIAFVDTPGYTNPESGKTKRRDKDVTLSEILSAHYLVWIVDCENGTLKEEDVTYIKRFASNCVDARRREERNPIYVVVNKADKKPPDDRASILAEVASTADKNGIACAGVGLYSAHEKTWYDVTGGRFDAFLDGINETELHLSIKNDVQAVLDRYIDFHKSEAARFAKHIGLLKRLDLLVDDELQRQRRLGKDLQNAWEAAEQEAERTKGHINAYRSLRQRFSDCIDHFNRALEVPI